MGTVVDRNGTLYFDFRYRGQRCRESSRLPATPQNRRHCDAALKRMEAEITLGHFDYRRYFPDSSKVELYRHQDRRREMEQSGVPIFADFAEVWFSEKRVEWRKSYTDTMRLSLDKYLLPTFGEEIINTIRKADILGFRAQVAKQPGLGGANTLSASRVNRIMTPLRMILNEAADRFEFQSPWQGIKPLKGVRSDVNPFTLEEVRLILERVRPDFKNYFTVRFLTGLRTAEIDGLKWRYVDFGRRQILIRETIVGGRTELTKTDGSQRAVEMSSPVFEALKDQYQQTKDISDYAFCNRDGLPLENRNVTQRVWYPLLRHLGLELRRPYQTRHTAATLWLASGENPEWIARQMGHTTTEMLFRVYSRFVPNLTRRDGSAFEQLGTVT